MATTYTLISSNTLSSSAASVTFSSIPSTYTDLVLKISARSDISSVSVGFIMYFNSDTGTTNYSGTALGSDGSTAFSVRSTTSSRGYYSLNGDTSTANTFSNAELYIPNYVSSNYKPTNVTGATETNATATLMGTTAGLWRSTSAITSVQITPAPAANFLTGSSFYLYGIKNS